MGGAEVGQLLEVVPLAGCEGAMGCEFGSRRDGNNPESMAPVSALQEFTEPEPGFVCAYAGKDKVGTDKIVSINAGKARMKFPASAACAVVSAVAWLANQDTTSACRILT